jgi:hypothetical protein
MGGEALGREALGQFCAWGARELAIVLPRCTAARSTEDPSSLHRLTADYYSLYFSEHDVQARA